MSGRLGHLAPQLRRQRDQCCGPVPRQPKPPRGGRRLQHGTCVALCVYVTNHHIFFLRFAIDSTVKSALILDYWPTCLLATLCLYFLYSCLSPHIYSLPPSIPSLTWPDRSNSSATRACCLCHRPRSIVATRRRCRTCASTTTATGCTP